MTKNFTHIEDDRVVMVDISHKENLIREAVASGGIYLARGTIRSIVEGKQEKGNVLATARVAAIQAIKRTSDLIPLCHHIPITKADVDFTISEEHIEAIVKVRSVGKTGVEMEALTGVSIALLTIWDMVKSAEKDDSGNYPHTRMNDIKVIAKVKGPKTM